MSSTFQTKQRPLLDQTRLDIVKFPQALKDDFQSKVLRHRFKLALHTYPHNVAPGIKERDGKKIFRMKCLGVDLTELSFHAFISTWLGLLWTPTNPKTIVRNPDEESSAISLKIDDEVFDGVYPVSATPDSQGYYEFYFTK